MTIASAWAKRPPTKSVAQIQRDEAKRAAILELEQLAELRDIEVAHGNGDKVLARMVDPEIAAAYDKIGGGTRHCA